MRPHQRAISPEEYFSSPEGSRTIAAGIVSLGAMGVAGYDFRHPSTVPELPNDYSTTEPVTGDNKGSFEAGVQLLRELPDDQSDDGGVDVALAKLEGTFQRKPSGAMTPGLGFRMSISEKFEGKDVASPDVLSSYSSERGGYEDDHEFEDDDADSDEHRRRVKRRNKHILDQVPLDTPPALDGHSDRLEKGASFSTFHGKKFSFGASNRKTAEKAAVDGPDTMSSSSFEMDLDRVDSGLERHLENTRQKKESEYKGEFSSALSLQAVEETDENSTFTHITPKTALSELSAHPARPPLQPLKMEQTMTASSMVDTELQTPRYQPQVSSSGELSDENLSPRSHITHETTQPKRLSRESEILYPTAIHLPFILAYDSELLAKQFTLIEKDALLEIDWKELVELSWSQTDADVKDWVELLNSRYIKGVEVVIARFNLVR